MGKMNLPNKLTLSRVIAIPIFVAMFVISMNNKMPISILGIHTDVYRLIAATIFIFASITDYYDGKIAREQNLVSDFGKLLDPLADKMLVVTALILLTENKEVHYLCTLVVVLRELTISSIRLVALERGIVIAASIWGKLKTATQMVALVLILFNFYTINVACYYFTYGLFYLSTAFVIISLIDYIVKSKEVFAF